MIVQTESFKFSQSELDALIADKLADYDSANYMYNKVQVPLYKLNEYLGLGYSVIDSKPSYLNRGSVLMLKLNRP